MSRIQHHKQKGLFMKPAGGLHPGGLGISQGQARAAVQELQIVVRAPRREGRVF